MSVSEYIGVYHADGGLVGEVRYIVGHLLGRAHCSLCDITHSPLRRKRQWDEFVAGLDAPFRLLHLNEVPPDVGEIVARRGSPLVLSRSGGRLHVLLEAPALEDLGGSVPAFQQALADAQRAAT